MSRVYGPTLRYWFVSQAWHQRPGATNFTTSMALRILGKDLDDVKRKTALFPKMWELKAQIINGRPVRSKKHG